ncbi:hypothetical protein C8C77_13028 [Halanaerobium saccharolyticum]|uniref:DUF5668 domain-containing protein n=1 Tax=Halanaerobium saccharolyticum TaxID=43595 RepID=A0A4R7YUJ9_9FIRM|nr:hypothetical protein [Halanaerobium saccharolyticum]RAK05353.1 hypothetical protein C7958_12727 [Halanaerobium saccharolyticum]TDV99711.1 hypothetical protein C8C77_13028 [Halanaerobium saccharolyticum]TDX51868.1 hypothetical protein C7956_12928 [Halanaerobium saccharolyticum]
MDKKKLGILLIAIGIFILLNTLNLISDDIFLYLLSGGFLFAYFMLGARKHYGNIGFLIPGTVLLAIALFSDLEKIEFIDNLGGGVFFILLGLAFAGVLIHTNAFKKWDWPIYPAGALIIFGLFVIFIDNNDFIQNQEYLNYITPVVLIILGSYFLYQNKK